MQLNGLPKFPWERRYHEDAEVERSATQVFFSYGFCLLGIEKVLSFNIMIGFINQIEEDHE